MTPELIIKVTLGVSSQNPVKQSAEPIVIQPAKPTEYVTLTRFLGLRCCWGVIRALLLGLLRAL